ncbi:uncharacterized protein LY79DRAFT_347017 [Colletotrichum navitas]|uniref:Uncharacterized protein n=1 Tax=Colletotrichum navitas TaxID=681940 RepID=A0AAD8PSF3_9PEZI|nr:uncharacterized protein LY79DRAFT_347017 [Colletotrichum navitas]KAK1579197.1 hypothetical protein LY79DRAFT_347017 [Colletotrichum navitas]
MVVMGGQREVSKGSNTPGTNNGHGSLLFSPFRYQAASCSSSIIWPRHCNRPSSPPAPDSPDIGLSHPRGRERGGAIVCRANPNRIASRGRACAHYSGLPATGKRVFGSRETPRDWRPLSTSNAACSALSNGDAHTWLRPDLPSPALMRLGTGPGSAAHRIKETVGEHSETCVPLTPSPPPSQGC